MKFCLKKRLTALLLAAVLTLSLAPAALATEEGETEQPTDPPAHVHTPASEWSSDASGHWHACSGCSERLEYAGHSWDSGTQITPPTCYSQGTMRYTCTVCRQTMDAPISTISHNFDTSTWKWDNNNHWHACTNSGCTATTDSAPHQASGTGTTIKAPTCTEKGQSQYTCSICGAVYTVETASLGGHVDASGDGICDRPGCGAVVVANYTVSFQTGSGGSSIASQTVRKGSAPANPGNPVRSVSNRQYAFVGWTTSPSSNYVYMNQSYLTSAQVAATPISGNTTYYALYRVNAYSQNLSFDVSSASNSGVAIGATLRTSLYSTFSSAVGSSFSSVSFGSESGTSYGRLYRNSSQYSLGNLPYTYSTSGSYPLSLVYFVPTGTRGTYTVSYTATDGFGNSMSGIITIATGKASGTISYEVAPGKEVSFDGDDFNDVYQAAASGTLRWVEFSIPSTLTSYGTLYYDYGGRDEYAFSRSSFNACKFYYGSPAYGDYPLDDISFVADRDAPQRTVSISFRAYYSTSRYVDGTMTVEIKDGAASGTISYEVAPGKEVSFDGDDFNDVYQAEEAGTLRWVEFTVPNTLTSYGTLYYDYGGRNQYAFSRTSFNAYKFYYSSSAYGDYPLDGISFVADRDVSPRTISIPFRAYYSTTRYVDGTLTLEIKDGTSVGTMAGSIRYATTPGSNVQINANDIARYFQRYYPDYALQYVKLGGVPSAGSLYYNYYNASKYGASRMRLTASNCDSQLFYFSPASTSLYALTELTYIPTGSNYCVTIPFVAYSSTARAVSGTILISVSNSTVAEVYGVTPRGTAVSFPASSIYSAVYNATRSSLASIQLLSLPVSTAGTVYVGSGTSTRATTSTLYTYASGTRSISQLRFVPTTGFTGSVEIPYVAYNSSNQPIACGTFSLGVVKSIQRFSDMSSSTWCYKYVTELSDADVIDGYQDGSFKPNSTVTYGAALKLIMLAAGYPVQKPTTSNTFSGYLARAKADGLVSGNVNLSAPISRLAVAQIAAKAMKLDISNLSSVKPFTDTSDVYVQALNAAGIIEGYFSNGTSTYKPNNTLTRGQISAIVWRMEQAK